MVPAFTCSCLLCVDVVAAFCAISCTKASSVIENVLSLGSLSLLVVVLPLNTALTVCPLATVPDDVTVGLALTVPSKPVEFTVNVLLYSKPAGSVISTVKSFVVPSGKVTSTRYCTVSPTTTFPVGLTIVEAIAISETVTNASSDCGSKVAACPCAEAQSIVASDVMTSLGSAVCAISCVKVST